MNRQLYNKQKEKLIELCLMIHSGMAALESPLNPYDGVPEELCAFDDRAFARKPKNHIIEAAPPTASAGGVDDDADIMQMEYDRDLDDLGGYDEEERLDDCKFSRSTTRRCWNW